PYGDPDGDDADQHREQAAMVEIRERRADALRARGRRWNVRRRRRKADEPLGDKDVAVEAEVLGVLAKEAALVRAFGQRVHALLLERLEIAHPDHRRGRGFGQADAPASPSLPKTAADLEHVFRTPR